MLHVDNFPSFIQRQQLGLGIGVVYDPGVAHFVAIFSGCDQLKIGIIPTLYIAKHIAARLDNSFDFRS